MTIRPEEILAIGFPLFTAAVLAAFFPIRLRDYFAEGEIKTLGSGLTPYKFKPVHYLYIFGIYLLCAVFLTVLQAYLLWYLADDPANYFSSRFTDYMIYPVFPSALMAVLLMLFVFSYLYARRGEDDVRKFLLRNYEGWQLYKDIPRYRPVALAAGLLCAGANFWIYNIYINVTDRGIVYSEPLSLEAKTIPYDEIWYLEIMEDGAPGAERDAKYSLRVRYKDWRYLRTEKFFFYSVNELGEIDALVRAADRANGGYVPVIMTRNNRKGKIIDMTLEDTMTREISR